MRIIAAASVVLIVAASNVRSAAAQTATADVSGGPAWVNQIGVHNSSWHLGGNPEVRSGAVGFGGGLDYIYLPLARRRYPHGGSESPAAGILAVSFHGAYHFHEREMHDRRAQPFMNVGMTFMLEREALPMFSIAGGVDWWATRHAGLRFEVRDQFVGLPMIPAILGVRFGVVLR